MFQGLLEIFRSFGRLFIWWVTFAPWEQGLRVRLGRHVKLLGAGVHLRLPLIDAIYRQSTRLRFSDLKPQTVTTADGHTLTFAGYIGYTINDVKLLYETLHHAEDAVCAIAMGAISDYVFTHTLEECAPDTVQSAIIESLNLAKFGLGGAYVVLTTFARVKTYRLIMDEHPYSTGDSLSTQRDERPNGPSISE